MITLTQPSHNVCQPLSVAPEAIFEFIPDGMLKIGEDRVTDKKVKSERHCKIELRYSHGRLESGLTWFGPTSLNSHDTKMIPSKGIYAPIR